MKLLARFDPVALAVRRARQRLRNRAGLRREEVTLPSGLRLAYLDGGRPDDARADDARADDAREPLVLVHGIGASKDHWPELARRLQARCRVLAPDLPGFGESDKPDEPALYSMPGQAETLLAFADALGLDTFHLAGSSMGGRIAAELAHRHPERLRTLWLLDPAGAEGEAASEMIRGLYAGQGVPLFSRTAEEYAAAMAFTMSRPPALPRLALRVLAAESAAAYERNHRIFRQMAEELLGAPSTEALLRGLPVPTLISWGAEDRVLHPSGAATLAAALPDATVRLMPGTGHLPLLEDPDATAADFLAFLDAHAD